MKRTIDIDNELINKVKNITGAKTKKEAVDYALRLLVALDNQKNLINLFGKVEIDDKAFE